MIRIGLIGCGYWGSKLSRVLGGIDGCEVVAVCDTEAARSVEVARMLPRARLESDSEEVLHATDVDAVFLATPPETHYGLCRSALEEGKHVFVEKPLALSFRQAMALVRLAEAEKRVLRVDQTFLYHPAVRELRCRIREGEIGSVYYVRSERVNFGRFRGTTNVIWDLAPHDLSILHYVLGEWPEEVTACLSGHEDVHPEAAATVALRYAGGPSADLILSWIDPLKVRRMVFVGTEGVLEFDDRDPAACLRIYRKTARRRFEGSPDYVCHEGTSEVCPVEGAEPLRAICEDFFETISRGHGPDADLATAALGVRVLEAIEASARLRSDRGRIRVRREDWPIGRKAKDLHPAPVGSLYPGPGFENAMLSLRGETQTEPED